MSHLVKMVQARTLHLQRIVSSHLGDEDNKLDGGRVADLAKRLEELEAHVADTTESAQQKSAGSSDLIAAKSTAQATSEIRKSFQPELDALNRAVRRYEKRTTISSLQTESRLQELESRLKDVVVLAAAAQRNAENRPRNFIVVLVNWVCGAIVLPIQYTWNVLSLPSRGMHRLLDWVTMLLSSRKSRTAKETKSRLGSTPRPRERRSKPAI